MRRGVSSAVTGLLLVAAACVQLGPRKDLSRYFVLSPQPADSSAPGGPVVAVGPVTLPDYLDRNVLVTRVGPNEVHPAASDWWAEPLAIQVPATLARNLAGRLGASRAVTYPWPGDLQPDVTVRVAFAHFEADGSGTAHLDAEWWVDVAGTERSGATAISEPAPAATADAEVAALSRLLGRLSDEIAAAAGR
jgi:uncharacterized lipoprotein YmbA